MQPRYRIDPKKEALALKLAQELKYQGVTGDEILGRLFHSARGLFIECSAEDDDA